MKSLKQVVNVSVHVLYWVVVVASALREGLEKLL